MKSAASSNFSSSQRAPHGGSPGREAILPPPLRCWARWIERNVAWSRHWKSGAIFSQTNTLNPETPAMATPKSIRKPNPQPWKNWKPKENEYGVNFNLVQGAPELAARVTSCISWVAWLDVELVAITTHFLQADVMAVNAMLVELPDRTRMDAIKSAGRVALEGDEEGFELLKLVFDAIRPVKTRRNEFAHNIWAIPTEAANSLVMIPAKHWNVVKAESVELNRLSFSRPIKNKEDRGSGDLDPDTFIIYGDDDLRAALAEANEAQTIVRNLGVLIGPDRSSRRPVGAPSRSEVRAMFAERVRVFRSGLG
jgi:hypothetical protein